MLNFPSKSDNEVTTLTAQPSHSRFLISFEDPPILFLPILFSRSFHRSLIPCFFLINWIRSGMDWKFGGAQMVPVIGLYLSMFLYRLLFYRIDFSCNLGHPPTLISLIRIFVINLPWNGTH